MRRRPLALALALASACGSSGAIEITQSRTTAPGPFDRLAVYVSLPSGGGDRGIFHGFKNAMPGKLAACAVESTVVAGMPETDPDAPVATPAPGAQLIVRARYGRATSVTTVNEHGAVLDDKAFKELALELWFELHDFKLDRATWLAFANVTMQGNGSAVGEQLAQAIVQRMKADGVLVRCR